MAIIYTYPTKATPNDNDLILISDSEDSNKTKQVKISTLPGGSGSGVSSVTAVLPLASTGGGTPAISLTGLTGFGTTGQVIKVNSNADGLEWGTDGGSVPDGNIYEVQYNGNGEFAASTTFTYENRVLSLGVVSDTAASSLKIYGGGSADSRLTLFCSAGTHGVTLEGPDHTGGTPGSYTIKLPNSLPSVANQVLESNASGTLSWIPTPTAGVSYTAGDGLQLNGAVFSTDLKENGGLVIETNELALDLAASSITGTLATSDGGTGSSNTEYCNLEANVTGVLPVGKGGTGVNTLGASRLILGNGTSAVTSISSQTKGTIVVGDGITTNILGVGTDGHVLTAASGDATGVRWTAATVSASDISSGTLSVDNGGTGANYDPTAGGVIFGNANEDGYAQASGLSYVAGEYSLKVVSTGNAYPSGLFENPNVTSAIAGGGNGTYTSSIGALNVFNNSAGQTNGATAIAVAGSDNIANSKGRLMSFYMASHLGAGLERVGDITADRGTGTVAFANVSDYRLKENVVSLPSSTNKIKALNPVSYNMIGFDKVVEGFLAHELQAEFPDAVTGEKDAVDSDGNINPQMVDYTKIIPTLVGAIKELTARIEALEA